MLEGGHASRSCGMNSTAVPWRTMLLTLLAFAALVLGGCATAAFPPEILEGVNQSVTLSDLRISPGAYLDQKVVLGGEIVDTRPKPDETEVEVLSRPLDKDERPARTDRSDGRFLVVSKQFLDPAVYAKGRRLTVIGTVRGETERPIGDQQYLFPVIAAEQIRLWPQEVPAYYYPYPYYYPYYPYPWGWGGLYFGAPWYYRPWPYWW
jgi:outer membrane lipoprotein